MDINILTKTFDSMPTGVGIFHLPDLNDVKSIRYVYMNKIILHEMSKNKEEVHGKKVIKVAPEAFEQEGGLEVSETYRKVAREGGVIDLGLVEYSNEIVKGIYECSVHYIEKHYVYVMLNNVTKSEKAKKSLKAKNKQLSQYAHLVAHDLKEPIRSVRNFTELLQRYSPPNLDDKTIKWMNQITESSTRMYKSIEGLLELSKLQSSKTKKK